MKTALWCNGNKVECPLCHIPGFPVFCEWSVYTELLIKNVRQEVCLLSLVLSVWVSLASVSVWGTCVTQILTHLCVCLYVWASMFACVYRMEPLNSTGSCRMIDRRDLRVCSGSLQMSMPSITIFPNAKKKKDDIHRFWMSLFIYYFSLGFSHFCYMLVFLN